MKLYGDSKYIEDDVSAKLNNNEKSNFKEENEKEDNQISGWMIFVSVIFSLAISVGLFMLLPNFISSLIVPKDMTVLYNFSEAVIRIVLFLIYFILVSQMKDIKRTFEYHGAEHKTIFCYEYGEELTVENVRKYKRFHERCGTSFIVFVMVISIIIFSIIGRHENIFVNLAYRIVALPLVAGISYEIIKWAGRSKNILVVFLSKPGLWLQRLTTREPDDSQLEVAIAALKDVLPKNGEDDKW